ncbi:MAG: RNA 2',3'-cyclic phosphodiesterase [Gammaproteobacteria bacterium]
MKLVKRLFFALWPSAEISHAIQSNNQIIEQSVNGNFVAQSNWHITLAFLGDCDHSTVNCLIENANTIQCFSFEVEFTTVMYFKKTMVVSYGVAKDAPVNNLNSLAQKCKQIQEDCGLKSEARDFKPHITVLRKSQQPQQELIINPILWQAKEFVLVVSERTERGSNYSILQRWNLLT